MTKLHYSPASIAELLVASGWCEGFSPQETLRISDYFEAHEVSGGRRLFQQGGKDCMLGILVKGQVHIEVVDGDDRVRIATLSAPQTFGELSLIDGKPRSADVVAESRVEFLVLTRTQLDLIADQYPRSAYQLLLKITQQISERLRVTSGQLADYLEVDF